MEKLINVSKYLDRSIVSILLKDRTTEKNIIWAVNNHTNTGDELDCTDRQIETDDVLRIGRITSLKIRVMKSDEQKQERKRKRAEVFTPSWICNMMNNHLDEDWFGRKDVFNIQTGTFWKSVSEKAEFEKGKSWKDYVDSRRLEITCGEAPYIVSRYDTATGDVIEIGERVGFLDRKLRVVGENAKDEKEWLKWALRAFQSCYGYEFQGDSLINARLNLIFTFMEYLEDKWGRQPTEKELKKFSKVISWNLWQADGLKDCAASEAFKGSKKDQLGIEDSKSEEETDIKMCKIYDWRERKAVVFNSLKEKRSCDEMKFDYVIGNPPYQEEALGENATYAPPVYNKFMDASYSVADKVELIHPARFLFNAGSTPKDWNKKMLADNHFKILYYEQDSSKVFANTDIKGGVAISYRDKNEDYGAIENFIVFDELRSIVKKVSELQQKSFNTIIYASESYKFSKKMHVENPCAEGLLSAGHKYDFKTSVFDKLNDVIFFDEKPNDGNYVQILGLVKGNRLMKWIKLDYIVTPENFESYKVFVPAANGSGALGEVLSTPLIGQPY